MSYLYIQAYFVFSFICFIISLDILMLILNLGECKHWISFLALTITNNHSNTIIVGCQEISNYYVFEQFFNSSTLLKMSSELYAMIYVQHNLFTALSKMKNKSKQINKSWILLWRSTFSYFNKQPSKKIAIDIMSISEYFFLNFCNEDSSSSLYWFIKTE